jgi:hypothetical protein
VSASNPTAQPTEPEIPFSLIGGPVHSLLHRGRLAGVGPHRTMTAMVLTAAATWLPMAILSAAQGVLWGDAVRLPLLLDIGTGARFLLAAPLLIFAGAIVDRRLGEAVNAFIHHGVVSAGNRPSFDRALERLAGRRDSLLAEIVLLSVSVAGSFVLTHSPTHQLGSSWITPDGSTTRTLAGWWLDHVGSPVLAYLLLRWLWRIAFWSMFLRDVSRIDLRIFPTNSDHRGGLGFLGEAHATFGLVLAPVAIIMAAKGVTLVSYAGWSLERGQALVAVFLVLGILLAFGPLLVFTPRLARARSRGIYEYGRLSTDYVRLFDRKWNRGREASPDLLGSSDIQSLADMSNSFEVVRTMLPVPVETRHVVIVASWMILPMVPFIATVVPLKTMLTSLLGFVMNAR